MTTPKNRHHPHDGGPPTDLFMLLNLTEDDLALFEDAVRLAWTTRGMPDTQVRRLDALIKSRSYQDIDEFRSGAIEPDEGGVIWRELFPDGRVIYYEDDDPEGFAAEIRERFGFDPAADIGWTEHRRFYCPPEHLDAIYGSDEWRMGS